MNRQERREEVRLSIAQKAKTRLARSLQIGQDEINRLVTEEQERLRNKRNRRISKRDFRKVFGLR